MWIMLLGGSYDPLTPRGGILYSNAAQRNSFENF